MHKFELPVNVKQIGGIEEGMMRVYLEDYVITYLKQYAESSGESSAFLIGKFLTIDNQPILFINGAVSGKYCDNGEGVETFSEKSFLYAEQQIDKYFNGCDIVGWMQSQPGYGTFLNPNATRYHKTHFRKPFQVLFINDPVEKLNSFYIWDADMNELSESKGYFVYYDKNPAMQAYMVDNKLISLDLKEKEVNAEKMKKIIDLGKESGARDSKRTHTPVPSGRSRTSTQSNYNTNENKRLVNMLISLSAVLFIISFIMGAGLVQNNGRIDELEAGLKTLSDTYVSVLAQIKQGSAPVFAQQNPDNQQIPSDLDERVLSVPSSDVPGQGDGQDNPVSENTEGADKSRLDTQDKSSQKPQETPKPTATGTATAKPTTAEPATDEPATDEPDAPEPTAPESATPEPTVKPPAQVINVGPDDSSTNQETGSETERADSLDQETSPTADNPQNTSENTETEVSSGQESKRIYVVQEGDNLNFISLKFFGTTDRAKDIMDANGIVDPNKIYFGKRLVIPD